MKTGMIEIKFREGIEDEDIQRIVSYLYKHNEKDIQSMTFSQYADEEVFKKAKELLKELKES